MTLRGGPTSALANQLVDHLLQQVVLPSAGKREKSRSAEKLRRALGALLHDLFDLLVGRGRGAAFRPRCGWHGTSPKDFLLPVHGFGRTTFLAVTRALDEAGYLEVENGGPRWHTYTNAATGEDVVSQQGGLATRFRLSQALLHLAAANGVEVSAWREHWRHAQQPRVVVKPDVPRVTLSTMKVRVGRSKSKAQPIPLIPDDPTVARLVKGVHTLNDYLARHDIGGIAFPGLQRRFNDGDQPGHGWRRGGRFYSLPGGDRYEHMGGELRRERITIDGEQVGEADITASHITLLHALLGEPFDASVDPYAIQGLAGIDRELVKLWVAQALGISKTSARQWSSDAKEYYADTQPGRVLKDDWPIRQVRDAVMKRHPGLGRLEACGIDTLSLQFHESEILIQAMTILREREELPALPIHDGLIVPVSRLDAAAGALKEAFSSYLGSELGHPSSVTPEVKLKVA